MRLMPKCIVCVYCLLHSHNHTDMLPSLGVIGNWNLLADPFDRTLMHVTLMLFFLFGGGGEG